MITAIRKRLEDREEGFTLIELLVVIIIIAILAAIAIPTFLRQREKSWDSAAQSELRNAATAQESWATDHNGVYGSEDNIKTEGYNQSGPFSAAADFVVNPNGSTGYCMQAHHVAAAAGDVWSLSTTTRANAAAGQPANIAC